MAEKKKKSDSGTLNVYDKRVVDRNVQRGSISRPDLEAYLKGLPDLTEQADNIADKVYGENGSR